MYEIRIRPWWIDNPDWPDGVEPCATPWEEAYLHSTCDTEKEAVAICKNTILPGITGQMALI